MNRVQMYARVLAEFEKLGLPPNLLGIQTVSDQFKHWVDVPPEQQPAIFTVPETEQCQQQHGVPNKWTVQINVWVYVRKQGDVAGTRQLWPILDAIEELARPKGPAQSYENTLGGSVVRFSISGTTEISGGYLGDQVVAVVPLIVVVA